MFIVVLNDGETYSDIDGVTIHEVPDNTEPDEIENLLAAKETAVVCKNLKKEIE